MRSFNFGKYTKGIISFCTSKYIQWKLNFHEQHYKITKSLQVQKFVDYKRRSGGRRMTLFTSIVHEPEVHDKGPSSSSHTQTTFLRPCSISFYIRLGVVVHTLERFIGNDVYSQDRPCPTWTARSMDYLVVDQNG